MRRVNNWHITNHFRLCEFEEPGTHLVMVHPVLLAALDALRERLGRPIVITSGYRGAQHNADVGGVPTSLHMRGAAADLIAPTSDLERLAKYARDNPELLVTLEEDHVHVEVAASSL